MVFDVPMAYDYMYTAFTGVALFLVTLQILKPLNFNQNFAILQSSLKYAAATVFWYIIIFTIMLTAFGTLAYALMGPLIRDFRDLKYAYVTLFGEYLCVCVCTGNCGLAGVKETRFSAKSYCFPSPWCRLYHLRFGGVSQAEFSYLDFAQRGLNYWSHL